MLGYSRHTNEQGNNEPLCREGQHEHRPGLKVTDITVRFAIELRKGHNEHDHASDDPSNFQRDQNRSLHRFSTFALSPMDIRNLSSDQLIIDSRLGRFSLVVEAPNVALF